MLQEITEHRIREANDLARKNPNNPDIVLECIDTLFIDLIQDDNLFYILKNDFSFHVATLKENDPRLFIHVFTEIDLARSEGERIGLNPVRITALELLQISKVSLFQDIFGIWLNRKIPIPIKRLLIAFNKRVLKNEADIDIAFMNCLSIISAIRKNRTLQLVCIEDAGEPAIEIDDVKKSYIMNKGEYSLPTETAIIRPVDLQTLFHMTAPIEVTTSSLSMVIESTDDLCQVLNLVGVTKESESYIPPTGFTDSPSVIVTSAKYKEVTDLSLSFAKIYKREDDLTTEEMVAIDVTVSDEELEQRVQSSLPEEKLLDDLECISLVEEENGQIPETPELHAKTNVKLSTGLKELISFLRERFKKFDNIEIPKEAEESNKAQEEFQESVEVVGIPDQETEQVEASSEEGAQKKKKPSIQISSRQTILIVIAIMMMLLIIRPLLFKSRNEANFYSDCLANDDYVRVIELYQQEYDPLIVARIEELIEQYASGEVNPIVVSSNLTAMKSIPNQEVALTIALEKARDIEVSKNAYVLGASTTDPKDKLTYWSAVIPEDTESYAEVQDQMENSSIKLDLLELIESTAETNWVVSREYTDIAYLYYPDNEDISRWKHVHDSSLNASTLSIVPIKITCLEIIPESNNSISIYIEWENSGFKTISQVSFLFSFYDKYGKFVEYQGNTVFRGVEKDTGPYEPGYSSRFNNPSPWGWTNIWSGNGFNVSKVALVQVIIKYVDGDTQVITNEADLKEILK